MDKLGETKRHQDRAIEIYKWCLDHPDIKFLARDAHNDSKSTVNIQAMNLLIDRGLITSVNTSGIRKYKLKRIAPIETCLDIPIAMIDPTIKRYRVFPSVACAIPTDPNLEQYAITK